ncbi:hypothetical protein F2P81_014199 [Scophthalmus maximus]|uniref:Uncharacterized protein n=1 Tax=Scophthalmus maximus TaxID=52904 RepID=A0A6A4SJ38_SCOMX|nr:hypothetical protein F2P81_014199 [Scophthalmus maximus]
MGNSKASALLSLIGTRRIAGDDYDLKSILFGHRNCINLRSRLCLTHKPTASAEKANRDFPQFSNGVHVNRTVTSPDALHLPAPGGRFTGLCPLPILLSRGALHPFVKQADRHKEIKTLDETALLITFGVIDIEVLRINCNNAAFSGEESKAQGNTSAGDKHTTDTPTRTNTVRFVQYFHTHNFSSWDMKPLILTSLLCSVVCSALSAQGSDATHSSGLAGVTGGPASGEGALGTLLSDDDQLDEDPSGGGSENFRLHESRLNKEGRKGRRGNGRRGGKNRSKATTSFNPEHTALTNGYTSTLSTTEDPCASTHLGYCIHGYCKHMEGLPEPVCICMKGYDGSRCGIQTLETGKTRAGESSDTELVQMVLVIIAVVLSVISCTAILLMTCAHWKLGRKHQENRGSDWRRLSDCEPAVKQTLGQGLEGVFFGPRDQTVGEGEGVFFQCVSGESSPPASVTWLKDGEVVTRGRQIQGEYGGGHQKKTSGTLHLFNVTLEDDGMYICVTHNPSLNISSKSKAAKLTVQGVPRRLELIQGPDNITVAMGTAISMHCAVRGFPVPMVHWFKNGCHLTNSSASFSLQNNGQLLTFRRRNATLRIQSARSFDEGEYVCEASNTLGQSRSTAILSVAEDGALHISSVQWDDGGEYYCTAENRAGRHQRRTVLSVTGSSSICDAMTNAATTFSTFSRGAVARLKLSQGPFGHPSQHHLIQPTTDPAQLFATPMPHPLLQPPPHPNVQPVDDHSQPPVTSAPLLISDSEPPVTHNQTLVVTRSRLIPEVLGTTLQYPLTESQSHLASSRTKSDHQVSNQLLTVPDSQGSKIRPGSVASQTTEPDVGTPMTQPPLRVSRSFGFVKLDSYLSTPTHSLVTQTMTSQSHLSQTQSHQLVTKSQLYQSYPEQTSNLVSQKKLENPGHPQLKPSPTTAQIPPTYPRQSSTFSFLPKFHLELSTAQTYLLATQPPPSSISTPQIYQVHSQPSTPKPSQATSTIPQTQPWPSPHPQPSISTIRPDNQTSGPSTLDPEITGVPQSNKSDQVQLNVTEQGDSAQSGKSANDTELTEWLKRNTSQSPMTSNDPRGTQQSPSWLPVVEKHDIPIVVGVGVSLAFIFITVTFYSVVQKNEPVPTSRAAQRNVGVPIRHAERRAEGRTYENRAFEDDDCVAVIEQSPNTSDTRARPPGPSLVTVQMEPTSEDLQEDTQPALDNHSVTIETYPESILDTKIDPSLEEENGCSLSQPSIQLQCAEDWTSSRGDNHSLCPDSLPPPSSLPSRSPSPSPPSRRDEGLHSSFTLQSPEQCVAPIHHSLSISHGNSPLLLSHHVSLGLTTVAVDVHFYPAPTASMAVGTSTRISSVSTSTSVTAPLFSPPLVNSRETDQSAARPHQCKQ